MTKRTEGWWLLVAFLLALVVLGLAFCEVWAVRAR